jgi:hypothetical protein
MFGEVSGKESKKETLIDVEKEKAKEAAKPLPGQIAMAEPTEREQERRQKRHERLVARLNKPKPEGSQPTKGELIITQDARSNQAKAMDNAQQHSIVVPMKSPRTKAWLHNPGSMDVETIDTKRVIIRTVPDHELKEKRRFSIKRRAAGPGRGRDLGADIVKDRRGRHLRL